MDFKNYKDELMEYLKQYTPELIKDKTEDWYEDEGNYHETFTHYKIEIKRKNNYKIEIGYSLSQWEYKDEPEYNEYDFDSYIVYAGVRIGDLRYSNFEPIKEIFEKLFNNTTCILIAELDGKLEACTSIDKTYTKDMHMRRIPMPLHPFPSIKEIKKFYKNHGTIKVIYWDEEKCFEYKAIGGKHPRV